MKIAKISLVFLLATLFIAGCNNGDQLLSPVENDGSTNNIDAFAKKGNAIQSVSGSGSFVDTQGDWRTFSFNAKLYADGTVKGQWQRVNHRENASESKSHGAVTCLTVDGNQAWLSGIATSGLFSEEPNNGVFWTVIDNGQGNSSAVDQMSLQFVGMDPANADANCAAQTQVTMYDVDAGNIQVK